MKHLVWLAALAGCGSSAPANVAGDYTVAVTDEDNGCNFMNWTQGTSDTGIPVTITQQNANATAVVTGATGTYLNLVLGSNSFAGTVDGDALNLELVGTRAATTGNCTYTYNATLLGSLAGDALSGKINYSPATNGNSDCASINGCVSFQNFNGTRPPP